MEIVNPCYSALSNLEVMETLNNVKDTKKKHGLRNLATITYETLQYLEETPCASQTRKLLVDFIKEVKPFNISSNETLMIINDPPMNALHIQLLLEDSEDRFNEEQVKSFLELVKKYLIPNPQPAPQ